MSIKPEGIRIQKILELIEDGTLKLPPFQRKFVWTRERIIDLVDSIYKGYPIGCIITWRSYDALLSKRNIGGFLLPNPREKFPIDYILDGQQRLTSIYAIFCKNRTIDTTTDEQYTVKPEMFNLLFDAEQNKFINEVDKIEGHDNLKMSYLFKTDEFFGIVDDFSQPHKTLCQNLYRKFMEYEVPFVSTERTKDDIGIIFERINNTAVFLSPLNLMVAWTWDGDFHLKEQIDSILDSMGDKGFEEMPEKIMLQCLGAIINKTAKTREILELEATKVRENIQKLQDGLEKAIDFLSTELGLASIDFLPHMQQIVPLTYFFATNAYTITATQGQTLKKWFWRTSFSDRYADSTDEKINNDITFIDKVLSNSATTADLNKYVISINESMLEKEKFSKGNPYARAFLLLLAQKKPKDLVTRMQVDPGEALSFFNRKEYHHIFPKKFLSAEGLPIEEINILCNFTFLTTDSNRKIKARAPSDYFFDKKLAIAGRGNGQVFASNLIPINPDIYKKDNYKKFIEERTKIILTSINSLI